MSKVDWSTAPEWATHALTTGPDWRWAESIRCSVRFSRQSGGVFYNGPTEDGSFEISSESWIILEERPSTEYTEDSVSSHYDKYIYRVKVTQDDADKGFKDIKIDPYRVASVCGVDGGPLEHILKKSMRGVDKGHTLKDVYKEIIKCAQRGIDMIEEDEQ